jgi:hypothetical protein
MQSTFKYTESIQEKHLRSRRKKTRKSLKLITNGARNITVQENKEKKKKLVSSSIVLHLSSKFLSFRSLHKHHKRQEGIIFHITALRERSPVHQQANKSTIRRGITQNRLKRLKISFHKARATSQ